jgi:hypothetical protein
MTKLGKNNYNHLEFAKEVLGKCNIIFSAIYEKLLSS